jgi:bifunctional non-homologous end joining protein LigD
VTIPDYVAIGVLIVTMLFPVARLFLRGSSETRELQSSSSLRPRTKFIEPCLPSPAKDPPDGPNWIHEIKHNGFRIMARREATGVRLITWNGNDLTSRFPHIAMAVAALPAQSCFIDGEAIVCDPTGLAVLDLMLGYRAIASAVFCAFDLLELDGEDLRCNPIESRKDALNRLLRQADPAGIVVNQHYKADGETLFRAACQLGRQGIVSKQLGSPYCSGRSKYWVKVKNPKTQP